ncbi:MAG: fused MFS/spermidine synthase [Gammaproteobacteria bacterium]|nr:fused MFS/spermidine synthase [Gammaproteobacteria bacterium]
MLSGFSALVYQVAWQRALLAIYGVNAESVTLVVTAFMAGLGLGSLLGGRLADRPRIDHLRVFAAIEGGVCAYGAGSLSLFELAGGIAGGGGPGAVFLATFALVLLPTALMGATLPLLVARAAGRSGNVGWPLAVLYFANTIGGAVAAVVAAVVLLRSFGLQATVLAAAAVNGLVALLALALRPASLRGRAPAGPNGRTEPVPSGRLAWGMACAALVGFASLSWEILWLRVYAFATGGTISVFGLFLGFYLFGIATGSLVARRACTGDSAWTPARIATAAGVVAAVGGVAAYLHSPIAGWVSQHGPPLAGLPVAAAAGALYGAILPMVTHCVVPADARTGRRVSYVYLANIVGASLGSALTGFVLLDVLGMAENSAALLLLSGVLAATLLLGPGERRPRRIHVAAVAAATAALLLSAPALYASLYERLLWKTPSAAARPFADVVETRAGVVTVTDAGAVLGTGVYDGRLNTSLDDDRNMIYRAYAVAALHPAPRRVLMIGLGSGSWAQVVAHLPGVEEVVVVEINAGYLDVVRRYEVVRSLLTNPKVSIVIDDGRRWLGRAVGERFDAIVANVTFHWRTNATHLLSRESMRLAASRLAPDGVLYFNATDSDEALRTGCTSFRSGVRFGSFIAVGNGDVAFDVAAFAHAIRTAVVDGRRAARQPDSWIEANLERLLDDAHLETCPRILARTTGVRLITDDNLASEASVPWYAYHRPTAD